MNFLDTNVVFYAASRGLSELDRPKRAVARNLMADGFVLSGQVLAEFYFNVTRKGPAPLSHDEATEFINLFTTQPCIPVDPELVVHGAALADRYKITYWDGAILAAAHIAGVDTLYSEDLNSGQRYGSVRVVNPFV